ncbi:MAG: hypothetical protein QOI06_2471 [Nocardioidaceae bacterium]|jgi:hypothetical protein|nr:hypothetical protein [Nocardioidaceae bacterium]
MKTARLVISIVAVAALVPLTASAALAAPPANDKPVGAIAMSLGDTVNQDTTQATTGTLDAKLNQNCGAPFTNASVWYTYTPSQNGSFILDMSQSDYSGGFMIFAGHPSLRTLQACGPTTLGLDGVAGTTYYFMVFSDTDVNGGNLVLSLQQGPPPPHIKVTVNPTGTAYANGNARVGGTVKCKNAQFVDIEGQMTQIWKRVKIVAFFGKVLPSTVCDGQAHAWTKVVTSDNGLYAAGDATVNLDTLACGEIDCTEVLTSATTTLHEAPGSPAASTAVSPRSGNSAACWSSSPGSAIRTSSCWMGGRLSS